MEKSNVLKTLIQQFVLISMLALGALPYHAAVGQPFGTYAVTMKRLGGLERAHLDSGTPHLSKRKAIWEGGIDRRIVSSSNVDLSPLFGKEVVFAQERVERSGAGIIWSGIIPSPHADMPPIGRALFHWDGRRALGKVHYQGRHFTLQHVEGQRYVWTELAAGTEPADLLDESETTSPDGATSPDEDTSSANADMLLAPPAGDDGTTIRVLFAYTASANARLNGQILQEIDLIVAQANQVFLDSGIDARLEVAVKVAVHYLEGPSNGAEGITAARFDFEDPSDGSMDEVHTLRETHKADVCVLLTGFLGGPTGVADKVSWRRSWKAFVATRVGSEEVYSELHEIGHLAGLNHNRENFLGNFSMSAPYAYGYRVEGAASGVRVRGVMAYTDTSDPYHPYARIGYFSNPDTWLILGSRAY